MWIIVTHLETHRALKTHNTMQKSFQSVSFSLVHQAGACYRSLRAVRSTSTATHMNAFIRPKKSYIHLSEDTLHRRQDLVDSNMSMRWPKFIVHLIRLVLCPATGGHELGGVLQLLLRETSRHETAERCGFSSLRALVAFSFSRDCFVARHGLAAPPRSAAPQWGRLARRSRSGR